MENIYTVALNFSNDQQPDLWAVVLQNKVQV